MANLAPLADNLVGARDPRRLLVLHLLPSRVVVFPLLSKSSLQVVTLESKTVETRAASKRLLLYRGALARAENARRRVVVILGALKNQAGFTTGTHLFVFKGNLFRDLYDHLYSSTIVLFDVVVRTLHHIIPAKKFR
jgi:hypothetical protein